MTVLAEEPLVECVVGWQPGCRERRKDDDTLVSKSAVTSVMAAGERLGDRVDALATESLDALRLSARGDSVAGGALTALPRETVSVPKHIWQR